MKNLPAIISLTAVAGFGLFAVAAALGVSCPFWTVAGTAWTGGVLAVFVTDYAPRRSPTIGVAVRVTETQRENAPVAAGSFDDAVIARAMATVGLAHDPATVSLS